MSGSPSVGRQAACCRQGRERRFREQARDATLSRVRRWPRSDCVPSDALEREMSVFMRRRPRLKPANIVEKILAGRVNKYYEEVCFENQKFVLDDSVTVAKAVKAEGGEIDALGASRLKASKSKRRISRARSRRLLEPHRHSLHLNTHHRRDAITPSERRRETSPPCRKAKAWISSALRLESAPRTCTASCLSSRTPPRCV